MNQNKLKNNIMTLFIITIVVMLAVYLFMRSATYQRMQQKQQELLTSDLEFFGISNQSYYTGVWPKNKGQGECIEFKIAGISFRKGIDKYIGEGVGTLEADPSNRYDPNAIKILAYDGHHLGFVPKDMTADVRKATTLPCRCYYFILKRLTDQGEVYLTDCYIDT